MKRFAARTVRAALGALGFGMLLASSAVGAGFAPAHGSPFPTQTQPAPGDNCIWVMTAGDLNNDGNLDVVVGCDHKVAVLLGDGRGGLVQVQGSPYLTEARGPNAIGVADFNGDGNEDVVVASYSSLTISTLFGDGTGRLARAPHSPQTTEGTSSMGVADFDRDLKPDVVIAAGTTIRVFLARGTLGDLELVPGNTFNESCCQAGLTVGDFNLDGRADIAVLNYFENIVWVLLGDGQGHFSPAPASPHPTGGSRSLVLAAADFDVDGRPDLAIGTYFGVSILLGDGRGGMSAAPGSPYPVGALDPLSLAVADFNGDGKPDVAATYFSRQAEDGSFSDANDVSVLLGDGLGGLSKASGSPIPTGGTRTSQVVAGDFNGDGRPDLAVLNYLSRDVSILLNYKNGAKLCEAQRDSIGEAAFNARYGTNGNGANAFGKCVNENKGF